MKKSIYSYPSDIAHAVSTHGLRTEFNSALLEQAEVAASTKNIVDSYREDLRDQMFFTIDGEDAKDFDDAICVKQCGAHGYLLSIAIADVTYYAKPRSALDKEAFMRGTSVYFPEYCIPMFPPSLSEDACSLVPKQDRKVLVCHIELDAVCSIVQFRFARSVLSSKHRFTYTQINQALSNQQSLPKSVAESFRLLQDIHKKCVAQKEKRGALAIESKELKISLNKNREVKKIDTITSGVSHSIIEECMILANRCAAQFLHRHFPTGALYRTHSTPPRSDIETLHKKLTLFQVHSSMPAKKEQVPNFYQQALSAIAKHSLRDHLNPVILQSLPNALYSPENSGHFGLGLDDYTHFTSPIRRYSDIVVHRLIISVLEGTASPWKASSLLSVCEQCTNTEKNAEYASRLNTAYHCCQYIAPHIGEITKATIMNFYKSGAFVLLKAYHTEAYLKHLHPQRPRRHNRMQQAPVAASGKYQVGQTIPVRIAEINQELLKVRVELVK